MKPALTEKSPAYRPMLQHRDKKDKMTAAEYKKGIGEIMIKYDRPLAEKIIDYLIAQI